MDWQTGERTEARTLVVAEATRAFMSRVYAWMFFGLAVTGAVAVFVASSESAFTLVAANYKVFALLLILFSIGVGMAIPRLNPGTAGVLFIAYAALLGAFLSGIFFAYELGSISRMFFLTGGTFGALSLYGTVAKKNLDAWKTFLFMGLFGVLGASIINLFWPAPMLSFVIGCAGIVVFSGLTAYDTQKLRRFGAEAEAAGHKSLAISGALQLYLDFINLFLSLLRVFGNRR